MVFVFLCLTARSISLSSSLLACLPTSCIFQFSYVRLLVLYHIFCLFVEGLILSSSVTAEHLYGIL